VPDALLGPLWPQIEPFLYRASQQSRGRYDVAWLAAQIASRDMQVWAAICPGGNRLAGALMTHMNLYPTGLKVLQVMAASGEGVTTPEAVKEVLSVLRRYARAQGCAEIEWMGRPGFSRLVRAETLVVMAVLGV